MSYIKKREDNASYPLPKKLIARGSQLVASSSSSQLAASSRLLLLPRFRSKDGEHAFAFQFGHAFEAAGFGEAFGEFEEQKLAAVLEHDSTSLELHVCFYLISVFQEFFGVFCFEIEVVIVGAWRKADLFDLALFRVRLHLLFLLLLFVEELFVVDHLAHRRIGRWRDLDKIEFLTLCNFQCFLRGINANCNVVAYQSDLWNPDSFVDTMFRLGLPVKPGVESSAPSWW